MKKADLILQISINTGIPKVDVLVVVEAMLKEIKQTLANGEHVYIRGFGSFVNKLRAEKKGRNIKQSVTVNIPAHFIPAFRPAREFMNAAKKLPVIETH